MSIYSVPCLMGVESLVADELGLLEISGVRAENGRVLFEGGADDCAKANINLRCGERVLLRVADFSAETFDELFEGSKAAPWHELIGREDAFPVKGHSLKSKLHSVPACQSIIKKAVVEKLRTCYGTQSLAETGTKRQIQFSIMNDRVEIFLDTTGTPLYRRGYKLEQNPASIRETLAAAMVKLSRFTGRAPFIDPMCGSGTIAIEAAMAALSIAPGARRDFDAERWGADWSAAFESCKAKALDSTLDTELDVAAVDIDPAAVRMTRENAERAGVARYMRIERGDALTLDYPDRGVLICNPPYGERMLDVSKARELYTGLGKRLVGTCSLKKYIISSDEQFEQHFGQKADKRRKLYNGMIKCNLYMYFRG